MRNFAAFSCCTKEKVTFVRENSSNHKRAHEKSLLCIRFLLSNYCNCVQNRAVRIITFSPYNAQTSPLLKHFKLPSIQDMIQQETVGMVYKASNNQAPEYLSVLFNRVSAMTGRTIRNAINLRPPRLNTTLAHNCFRTEGPCFGITCQQK